MLNNEKLVLLRLSESTPWQSFRLLLDKDYTRERNNSTIKEKVREKGFVKPE